MKQNPVKIVVTGGHATPALATIDVLKKSGIKIYWFGEKEAFEGQSAKTLEYQFVPNLGIPFFPIMGTKFHKKDPIKTILNLWKIPASIVQCISLFSKIKPDVLLSFGSYLAVPPSIAAYFLGIPIITHEQTTVPGLANRIIARVAKKVAITFPESSINFPKDKVVLTGNPMRNEFREQSVKKVNGTPVIFITGGSRGAHIINEAVVEILPELLKLAKVCHQTGNVDYPGILKKKASLHPKIKGRYEIAANFAPLEFATKLGKSSLVISRAGANTVLEIASLGIPAILIPISWSGGGEQAKNAQSLEKTSLAIVLPEESLTGESLLSKVQMALGSLPKMRKNAQSAKKLANPNASENLAKLVLEVASR